MRRLLITLLIFQGPSLCWAQNARETHKTIEGYGLKVMLRDYHDVRSVTAWDPETNTIRFEFPISQHAPPIQDIKFRPVDAGEHNQEQVALLEVEGLPLPFFDLGSGKPRFVKQDKTGRRFLSDPPEETAMAWCLGKLSDCANIGPLVPIAKEYQGLIDSVQNPGYRRILTEADWAEFQRVARSSSWTSSLLPLPACDFTQHMAVVILRNAETAYSHAVLEISAKVVEHADHIVFYFVRRLQGMTDHPLGPHAEFSAFILPRSTKRLILMEVHGIHWSGVQERGLEAPVVTVKEFESVPH